MAEIPEGIAFSNFDQEIEGIGCDCEIPRSERDCLPGFKYSTSVLLTDAVVDGYGYVLRGETVEFGACVDSSPRCVREGC